MPRPPLAWSGLLGVAAIQLALALWANGPGAYGFMTDELYYLDCADRLAWGYVDHPPLSIGVLWAWRALFGDSVFAIRLASTLASGVALVLVGGLAREMGGGRAAQTLAAFGVVCAPLFHASANFYSMNTLEITIWTAAAWIVARIVRSGDGRLWLALGATLGLGLLNKTSTLWLGAGLVVGLAMTPQRVWLATRWPWWGGAIALALVAPNLAWNASHDWPMLEFLRNSAVAKEFTFASPLGFLAGQLFVMGWPVWLEGLDWLLRGEPGRAFRWLGLAFACVFLGLMFSGSAKIYYLAGAYPIVFAAAGCALERASPLRRRLAVAVWAFVGFLSLPFTASIVPVETLAAWHRALGIAGPTVDVTDAPPVQQGLAQMFHGQAVTDAVARAYEGLSEADRARVGILTGQFGEAGGVNHYGRERGLPRAIGTHVSYWLWGPGDVDGQVMLVLSDDEADLRRRYHEVAQVAAIDCPYCMPDLRRKAVYLCRGPRRPLADEWAELKVYR